MLKKSRNNMTFERLKYYRHLGGGALECIASRLSKTPKPLCFSLMVTSACNCDCDFCFWKSKKGQDDMPKEEIIKLLTEAGQIGYMDSILWGGEPLLRQDFAEICKASHDAGLYTKIATNGWFLETNPDFAKYTDLSFISLDAIGKAHDDIRHMPGICDKVMSGIEYHKIHSPKIRIYICCTVSTQTNFEQIKEVAQYCKDADILLYFTVFNTKSTNKIPQDYAFDEIDFDDKDYDSTEKNNAFTEKNNAFENNYKNLGVKSRLSYLSPIERLFNNEYNQNTSKPLMQIGYDYFVAPVVGVSNNSGKFDDSYKFSIGEKVSAYLYGDSVDVMAIEGSNLLSPVVQTEVNSKGNIFIQGIGIVPAENKTIKDVETAINKKASAKYNNLKIKLNVASGQDFSVFVYGQVNKPGKVIVKNNSSIMDALGAAGGVKKKRYFEKN